MTVNKIDNMYEIKSSTYPEDTMSIRRISDNVEFGSCIVYENANRYTEGNYEEYEIPIEEAEEETDGNSDGIDN